MNDEAVEPVSRSKALRVVFGVLWFVPIYLVVQMVVGAVVGGIAGAGTANSETAYAAGQAASIAFFQHYGIFFLIGEILLTALLSVQGILPGTGRWKKA